MERRTKIANLNIFLMVDGWRADIEIRSVVGEGPEVENFSAHVNFPFKETQLTPDEIKVKLWEHFRSVFKEVAISVENGTFETMWPKTIFWESKEK